MLNSTAINNPYQYEGGLHGPNSNLEIRYRLVFFTNFNHFVQSITLKCVIFVAN
jgi:hypothetical protein